MCAPLLRWHVLVVLGFAFFHGVTHAKPVTISPREWLADLVQLFALPPTEQPNAFRRSVLNHLDLALELAHSENPAEALLDNNIWKLSGIAVSDREQFVSSLNSLLRSHSFQMISRFGAETALQAVPDFAIVRALDIGGSLLDSYKISSQPGFQQMLDPEVGISLKDKNLQDLAQHVIPRFFDGLDRPLKARICSAVIGLPAEASSAEQISAVLQNSGPLVQKLFQLIGGEANSAEISEAMASLKSNIKPIPREQIIEVLEKRFGREYVEKNFADISEPISSGSVGQAHFATLKSTGETVMIKVRRPGALEAFEQEVNTIRRVTKGTPYAELAEQFIKNIRAEFDFRIEAANLREGEIYVNPRRNRSVARQVPEIPAEEDVIVQKMALGKTIDKFTNAEELLQRGQATQELLEDWLAESMFGGGFFHGDLHSGNIFFFLTPDAKGKPKLTLIDFGNAGRLTNEQQRGFLKLMSGLSLASPQTITSALTSLGELPMGQENALKEDVAKLLAKSPPKPPIEVWFKEITGEVVDAATNRGISFPSSFLAFQRGQTFLEGEIEKINNLLDKTDPRRKLKRFSLMKPQVNALIKSLPSHLAKVFSGRGDEASLNIESLRNLWKAWLDSPAYTRYVRRPCDQLYKALVIPLPIP